MLVDGDEWWIERRIIARKLLDLGDAQTAYEVASRHSAEHRAHNGSRPSSMPAGSRCASSTSRPLAAHALRAAAGVAETPISLARAAYWQGRAAEAVGAEAGRAALLRARRRTADHLLRPARAGKARPDRPSSCGRRADPGGAARNGLRRTALHRASPAPARGVGVTELALPLYIELAQTLTDAARTARRSAILPPSMKRRARASLTVGKLAVQRGFPLDTHAYPTIGDPELRARSAARVEKAMVYAIARQESAFDPQAQSQRRRARA